MRSCIAHLQSTASDLKTLAGCLRNPEAEGELQKAHDSINACLQQCRRALDKLGRPV